MVTLAETPTWMPGSLVSKVFYLRSPSVGVRHKTNLLLGANFDEIATKFTGQRICQQEWGTEDWKSDPCCNPAKSFEQCCGLRDVQVSTTVIDSLSPADQCDRSLDVQLYNALLGYSTAYKLRTDPIVGCTAVRKQKFTSKVMESLFKFTQTCSEILYQGKTKSGLTTCKLDSECYTRCQNNLQSSNQPNKCSMPYENFESAFLECGLDNMDPVLLKWLFKKQNVSTSEPLTVLEKALYDSYAESTCTGPSASTGAACMLTMSEEECNSNLFNRPENNMWYGWRNPAEIYVDRSKSDRSACTAAGKRKWYNHSIHMRVSDNQGSSSGYYSYNSGSASGSQAQYDSYSSSASGSGDSGNASGSHASLPPGSGSGESGGSGSREPEPTPLTSLHPGSLPGSGSGESGGSGSEGNMQLLGCVCSDECATGNAFAEECAGCTQATVDFSKIEDIKDFLIMPAGGIERLSTTYLPDAPSGSSHGYCRLDKFNAYTHYSFMTHGLDSPSTVICSALGRAVATVNGLNSSLIEGHSTAFSPSYEWVYDQTTGNYGKKKMSDGNQEWCEYEKTCNHKPWDPTANSEEQ